MISFSGVVSAILALCEGILSELRNSCDELEPLSTGPLYSIRYVHGERCMLVERLIGRGDTVLPRPPLPKGGPMLWLFVLCVRMRKTFRSDVVVRKDTTVGSRTGNKIRERVFSCGFAQS